MSTDSILLRRLTMLTHCDVPVVSNISKQHTTTVLRLSDRRINTSRSLSVRQHPTDSQCFNKTFGGRAIKHEDRRRRKEQHRKFLQAISPPLCERHLGSRIGPLLPLPAVSSEILDQKTPPWAQHMVILIEQQVTDQEIMIWVNHSSRHALS
jgi:hypothetical protein